MSTSISKTEDKCACKGQNSCTLCEQSYEPFLSRQTTGAYYVYCPLCDLCWPGWNVDSWRTHPRHEGASLTVRGLTVALDVMSKREEAQLAADMDSLPWQLSQSGRRKQNFGPKCNFKRRKLKPVEFDGFPWFGRWLQQQLVPRVPALHGYCTIEQCSLEYEPRRGACIAPHVDDCWVWGRRVVSVNLLSDSALTLTPYTGDDTRYNLHCRPDDVSVSRDHVAALAAAWRHVGQLVVRVPMPRRSVVVLDDEARYHWLHCVLREDITSRRLCVALREFTEVFMERGEHATLGQEVRVRAQKFWTPS